MRTSDSQEMLPSPSLLRTGRASFPADGSSLSNALLRTRFFHLHFQAMDLSVAVRMQQNPVCRHVTTTIDFPFYMLCHYYYNLEIYHP